MMFLVVISTLSMLILPHPPMKMSLMLTMVSTAVAFLSYQLSNSVFLSSSVIISFSSGMMILFCYCSAMSSHEGKNSLTSKFLPISVVAAFPLMMLSSTPVTSSPIPLEKASTITFSSGILLFLMMMVILVMKGMNYSFFNPSKKLHLSY